MEVQVIQPEVLFFVQVIARQLKIYIVLVVRPTQVAACLLWELVPKLSPK
jgi:hypothetical protein